VSSLMELVLRQDCPNNNNAHNMIGICHFFIGVDLKSKNKLLSDTVNNGFYCIFAKNLKK